MKQQHVVLRVARSTTRDPFAGPSLAPTSVLVAASPTVTAENLDLHEVARLTQSADVVAVAPSIPMQLVEPIALDIPAQPLDVAATWGVQAVGADTSPFDGNGIVVAVLDTGIDAAHAAFNDPALQIIQKDFTGEGDGDRHGHGTHCAGTIFGRAVNGQRIGVAPGIKKALIGKVLGKHGGSSLDIASAILWAVENGANVISMSLGMDFTQYQADLKSGGMPENLATSRALEGYRANVQLFQALATTVKSMGGFGHHVILIAAAGNESQRDVNPDFEIAVSPPAVADGFISVAALGQATGGLSVATFSNTGANIAGPGVGILSAKLGGGLKELNGTSMATPHVAGVAALWAQKIKTLGPLTAVGLTAKLNGTAIQTGLQPGIDFSDIGGGLVFAPQS